MIWGVLGILNLGGPLQVGVGRDSVREMNVVTKCRSRAAESHALLKLSRPPAHRSSKREFSEVPFYEVHAMFHEQLSNCLPLQWFRFLMFSPPIAISTPFSLYRTKEACMEIEGWLHNIICLCKCRFTNGRFLGSFYLHSQSWDYHIQLGKSF